MIGGTVNNLTVQVAKRLGADHRPVSIAELHRAYLRDYPNVTVGRSIDSFAATLAYHCINMRSRFPNIRDRRAPADWLKRP